MSRKSRNVWYKMVPTIRAYKETVQCVRKGYRSLLALHTWRKVFMEKSGNKVGIKFGIKVLYLA